MTTSRICRRATGSRSSRCRRIAGLILDRNGLPLATNAPSYQLELTREQVEDLDATLAGLAELDLIDKADIPAPEARHSRPAQLRCGAGQAATHRRGARSLRRAPARVSGVEIRPRLTRYYPLGASSVHAIGYVGAISEEDKKRSIIDDYAGTTLTGKSGVERAYEKELHGRAGVQQLLVNAQGRSVERIGNEAVKLERHEPIAGNDLFLTIDLRVQQVAEEALRGQRAAAVAIDPSNGDILAFVSTPAFDPNLFARGLSRPQYLALTEDPDRPMYDRALRGVYPPGSTVKPLMALAALEYGVVTPHDTRFCRGMWSLPGYGRARRDWKPGGHGTVDMRKALATSCDVYFFDMARLMGIDRMATIPGADSAWARPPASTSRASAVGILPSTDMEEARLQASRSSQVWFPGDTISVGIGQGQMLVTPLQLAHAIADARRSRPALQAAPGARHSRRADRQSEGAAARARCRR